MSEQTSCLLPRILIGCALGAVAIVLYNRRGLRADVSDPQPDARLSPSARVDTAAGTPPPPPETIEVEPAGTGRPGVTRGARATNAAATAVQGAQSAVATTLRDARNRLQIVRASVQRSVAAARAQLDVAIAEGQAQTIRTRQELEARFNDAKKNPASARHSS